MHNNETDKEPMSKPSHNNVASIVLWPSHGSRVASKFWLPFHNRKARKQEGRLPWSSRSTCSLERKINIVKMWVSVNESNQVVARSLNRSTPQLQARQGRLVCRRACESRLRCRPACLSRRHLDRDRAGRSFGLASATANRVSMNTKHNECLNHREHLLDRCIPCGRGDCI